MTSFIWICFFKVHRKLYRIASPFLCRIYSFANTVTIKNSLIIGFPFLSGRISIEDGAILVSLPSGNPLGVSVPCRLIADKGLITIGRNFQASGVRIFSNSCVSIGDNVMIGTNCLIVDDDMHPLSFSDRIRSPLLSKTRPIRIGNDVWIGANVTVLKGVNIGERSVIGSGVIVRRDVAPDTVVYHSDNSFSFKSISS